MAEIETIACMQEEMARWRQDFHAHPELGFEENRTADIVAAKLREYGLEVYRGVGKTGVVGVLRAGSGARSVGLRADIAVIGGAVTAPYDAILAASPGDVRLVLVDGHALYGDDQLVTLGDPTPGCEALTICDEPKFLCVAIDGGDADNKFGQTFAEIEAALIGGLADYDALQLAPVDFSPLAPLVTCPP